MQQSAAVEQESEQQPKLRGKPWPKGTSGNPAGRTLGKRYLALYADLARDLGGEAVLSAIERALLGQAVGLLLRAERAASADDAVRLANASTRLLANLRSTKHKREPARGDALERYLAAKQGERVA